MWDRPHRGALWVDIRAGVVHRLDPGTGLDRSLDVGQPVGAACLREAGGYVVALGTESRFWVTKARWRSSPRSRRRSPRTASTMRNATPQGASGPGRSVRRRAGRGPLPSRRDHAVTPVLSDLGLSNGLGWRPDGTAMYFIDSLAGAIDVFDFDLESGSDRPPPPARRRRPGRRRPGRHDRRCRGLSLGGDPSAAAPFAAIARPASSRA